MSKPEGKLIVSLNSLSWKLQEVERFHEALDLAQESLGMSHVLTTDTSDSQYGLACVLDTIAVCLQKLSRQDDPQQLGREAVLIS